MLICDAEGIAACALVFTVMHEVETRPSEREQRLDKALVQMLNVAAGLKEP